jgi:hypothetical protein
MCRPFSGDADIERTPLLAGFELDRGCRSLRITLPLMAAVAQQDRAVAAGRRRVSQL